MNVDEAHVAALMRNYRIVHPQASKQLQADYAAERYLDSFERLAHSSPAIVDNAYEMVYNVGINL